MHHVSPLIPRQWSWQLPSTRVLSWCCCPRPNSLDHLRGVPYCGEGTAGLGRKLQHAQPRNTSTIRDGVNLSTFRLEDDLPEKVCASKRGIWGVGNACVGPPVLQTELGKVDTA